MRTIITSIFCLLIFSCDLSAQYTNVTLFNQSGSVALSTSQPGHYTGTISGNAAQLTIKSNGNPAVGLSVEFNTDQPHMNRMMDRTLEAEYYNIWQDGVSVPFNSFNKSLAGSHFYSCNITPWCCGFWLSAVSFMSASDSGGDGITFVGNGYGTGDVSNATCGGNPVIPVGHSYYSFSYNFSIPIGTNFTLDITHSAPNPGSSQVTPRLPNSRNQNTGTFRFNNPTSNQWYDPPSTYGYHFEAAAGGLFSGIEEFPVGIDIDNSYTLRTPYGRMRVNAPQSIDFVALYGAGVPWFTLAGINPRVDAANATAFPIKLSFVGSPSNFEMTPLQ